MKTCLNDSFCGVVGSNWPVSRQKGEKEEIRAGFFLLGEWVKEGFKKQAVQIEGEGKGQKDRGNDRERVAAIKNP